MTEKRIVIELESAYTSRQDVYAYLMDLIEDNSLEFEVIDNDET